MKKIFIVLILVCSALTANTTETSTVLQPNTKLLEIKAFNAKLKYHNQTLDKQIPNLKKELRGFGLDIAYNFQILPFHLVVGYTLY